MSWISLSGCSGSRRARGCDEVAGAAVSDSPSVAVMRRELGRQLAALRRQAGLTQQGLADRIAFSRPTVSVAEIGRQPHARQFWSSCDTALATGGTLARGHDQIAAVRDAEQRATARAAQEAREARALAAFTAARDHHDITAAVTAIQPCPECGCPVTIMTTLIPGTPLPAPAPPARQFAGRSAAGP
jgi:transcriptional regulator with XRE-family HTH domain